MNKVKAVASRKRVVGAGLLVALMAVVAVWSFNTRTTSAQSTGGIGAAIFTVTLSPATPFPTASATAGTTFFQEGDITFVNARGQLLNSGTGKFYRRGTVASGGVTLVTDVYDLISFGGAITAHGVLKNVIVGTIEQADLLAVTGGVGTFRSASGEAQITTVDAATGKFNVVIEESPRPPRFGNLVGPFPEDPPPFPFPPGTPPPPPPKP